MHRRGGPTCLVICPTPPTTPRSAASCAQIHPTRTDHGSWVLVSAGKAHERISPCNDDYNWFDVREWTRTESRVSTGSSTVAARNHGGGGPTTFITHGEVAQVRESTVLVVKHPLRGLGLSPFESDVRVQRRSVRQSVGRSSGRTRGGLSDPLLPPRNLLRRRKYPTRDDRDERDATTNTRRHGTRRHGAIRKSIARKPCDGDVTPSLTTATFPTRVSTRMCMRAGDDEAGARLQWWRRRRGAVRSATQRRRRRGAQDTTRTPRRSVSLRAHRSDRPVLRTVDDATSEIRRRRQGA